VTEKQTYMTWFWVQIIGMILGAIGGSFGALFLNAAMASYWLTLILEEVL